MYGVWLQRASKCFEVRSLQGLRLGHVVSGPVLGTFFAEVRASSRLTTLKSGVGGEVLWPCAPVL